MVAEQSPATRNPSPVRAAIYLLACPRLVAVGRWWSLLLTVCLHSLGLCAFNMGESATAGRLQRVGMELRPNRYDELTDLQRARVDRLINAVAAGRLDLMSDVCPSAAPVCRPRDLAWAARR